VNVSEINLILMGPPGAGKGTQAARLQDDFQLPYIATGDMLRANVKDETDLGKEAKKYMDAGDLVPDEVTVAMVRDRISQPDAEKGYLLDGFPRNLAQAKVLDDMLLGLGHGLDLVIELVVDDDEVVRRLAGRRTCRQCRQIWHIDFDPTIHPERCDRCGGELFQRDDDREETIRHRLEVYAEQTAPIVGYYAESGILIGVDATGPVEDVTERAITALRRAGN